MKTIRLLAALALVASTATTGVAVTNERPLADAGLDQTTTRGTTVYLDAGGSRDPDGTIATYNWTIRTPSGATTSPNCGHCERTNFRADAVGTFEVTLTVTDDDGATATDTLYVEATPGAPPDISLAGPTRRPAGEPANVTATVDAGAAPLDRIEWVVDGDTKTTTSVDGTAASATHTVRFPTTGTHAIRAVAVDTDGQEATSTHSITVDAPPEPTDEATQPTGNIEPPETGIPPTDDTASNDGNTLGPGPEIVGPQVVTGEPPLRATYRVTNAAAAEWVLDDDLTTTGTTIISPTLAAGYHELYAMPRGGGIATFSDNTRTIVADPAPNVHLERVVEESVVTVDAYATDDFENLRSLTVLVDGEPMESTTVGGFQRYTDGDQLTTITRLSTLTPGDHTVTVRATDARGQTDAESREIHVPGPPEIVSAGFVNPEPLSVYHPKLDPEDYTADFRVAVDLNGVEPSRIIGNIRSSRATKMSTKRSVIGRDPRLVIETDFKYDESREISANQVTAWDRGSNIILMESLKDSTVYAKTPPVIRMELVYAQNRAGQNRITTFDASESFDPDGTFLKYNWRSQTGGQLSDKPKYDVQPTQITTLEVIDKQGQSARSTNPLNWYVPELAGAEIRSGEIHSPEETVTFKVRTQDYELSKNTYREEIDFALHSEEGTVVSHSRYENRGSAGFADEAAARSGNKSYIYHEWTVSVPAEAFLDGQPSVTLQATGNPESSRELELPQPTILQPLSTRSEVTELDRDYFVRRQNYELRKTSDPKVREALKAAGFEVRNTENTGTEYHLEKRVKTQSERYERKSKEFASEQGRDFFAGTHPSWSRDGSETETRTRTVTETEWRDILVQHAGFTGDTRKVEVEPADYRTEYEYEYQKTRTYQTEETYEKTVERTVTETETRKQCGVFSGCTEREVEVEKTVEETVERTREVTKSYTTTEQYWSSRPRGFGHDRTGDRRRVKVSDAVHETQYEYRVDKTETYTERVYLAEGFVKVQSAQYEWQSYDVVVSERSKSMLTAADDIRVGYTEPTKRWILRQEDGVVRKWVGDVSGPSGVAKTRIDASVEVETVLRDPRDGLLDTTTKQERNEELTQTVEGYITANDAEKYMAEVANKTHAGYE